jgi:hypothetical protein
MSRIGDLAMPSEAPSPISIREMEPRFGDHDVAIPHCGPPHLHPSLSNDATRPCGDQTEQCSESLTAGSSCRPGQVDVPIVVTVPVDGQFLWPYVQWCMEALSGMNKALGARVWRHTRVKAQYRFNCRTVTKASGLAWG